MICPRESGLPASEHPGKPEEEAKAMAPQLNLPGTSFSMAFWPAHLLKGLHECDALTELQSQFSCV